MALTLGVHIGHDGGAAICCDGEIIVACNEERLTRKKYANGWWLSVRYCLDSIDKRLDEIDLIVFSNAGTPLPQYFHGGLERWSNGPLKVKTIDHHLSHAIGAFCFSPFESALVFVGDAGGNYNVTESAYCFDRQRWESAYQSDPARSRSRGLGTTYEAFTNFLGFNDQESGKTMALAAYGDIEFGNDISLFQVGPNGQIESMLANSHYWGVDEFSAKHSNFLGKRFPKSRSERAQNVAAYIQHEFQNALLNSTSLLLANNNQKNLVLSGGVGLNCITNQELAKKVGLKNFYAFPACSDCGLAIGNALYGAWSLDGKLPKPKDVSFRYGRNYNEHEILKALERHPDTVPPGSMRQSNINWQRVKDPNNLLLDMLDQGKIVGWWQGKSETGPRALGGRSILANPNGIQTRDLLNEKVKHREWFRPLAPSVLESQVAILTKDGNSSPYMNMAPIVTIQAYKLIPECIHVDGSARIHSVNNELAPELNALLSTKLSRKDFPAIMNTSFNVTEPIVETPGDAVATFVRSNLDALLIEDFLVIKSL